MPIHDLMLRNEDVKNIIKEQNAVNFYNAVLYIFMSETGRFLGNSNPDTMGLVASHLSNAYWKSNCPELSGDTLTMVKNLSFDELTSVVMNDEYSLLRIKKVLAIFDMFMDVQPSTFTGSIGDNNAITAAIRTYGVIDCIQFTVDNGEDGGDTGGEGDQPLIIGQDDVFEIDQDTPLLINSYQNNDVFNNIPEGFNTVGLAVVIVSAPINGNATVNIDNTINYAPNLGYYGQDEFTYKYTLNGVDLPMHKDSYTILINVSEVVPPVVPTITLDDFEIEADIRNDDGFYWVALAINIEEFASVEMPFDINIVSVSEGNTFIVSGNLNWNCPETIDGTNSDVEIVLFISKDGEISNNATITIHRHLIDHGI